MDAGRCSTGTPGGRRGVVGSGVVPERGVVVTLMTCTHTASCLPAIRGSHIS